MISNARKRFVHLHFPLEIAFLFCLLLIGSTSNIFLVAATNPSSVRNTFQAGFTGGISFSTGSNALIKADWNVPPVSCQPSLSQAQGLSSYVGLFAFNKSIGQFLFMAAGVDVECQQGSSTPSYSAVAIVVTPNGGIIRTFSKVTVSPGDTLTGKISIDPSTHVVKAEIIDSANSQSGSHSEIETFSTTNNFAQWLISPLSGSVGNLPLANFTMLIKFSHGTLTDSTGTHTIGQLPMLAEYVLISSGGDVLARPSALSLTGASFHIKWVAST